MNLRRITISGMTVAAFALSGCSSAPAKVDSQALGSVHTVAIIKAPEPARYTVFNWGSPAAAFGALGGAFVASSANKDMKGLQGALAREKFSFGKQLTSDLEKALKADGYKVRLITVKRESPAKLLKKHLDLMAHGVDAVLDVATMNVGYVTENWLTSPFWRPEARVEVALYGRAGTAPIYDQTYMYGYHNIFMSATNLDAPKQYRFKSKEAMESAGDRVLVGGLKDAANTIAQAVATKLNK